MTYSAQSDRLDSPACARRAGLLRLALVLLIVLLIGAPSLIYPFGRDQGEYATIAELALRGRVIYRDVFNLSLIHICPLAHVFSPPAVSAPRDGRRCLVRALRIGALALAYSVALCYIHSSYSPVAPGWRR